jgi:hypothetical protein
MSGKRKRGKSGLFTGPRPLISLSLAQCLARRALQHGPPIPEGTVKHVYAVNRSSPTDSVYLGLWQDFKPPSSDWELTGTFTIFERSPSQTLTTTSSDTARECSGYTPVEIEYRLSDEPLRSPLEP